MSTEEARMSFFDHLEDLRKRLIRAFAGIFLMFGISLYFSEEIFAIIAAPITRLLPKDSALVFTGLPDPVFTYLKVDFLVALLISLPFVLYQIWLFVHPGLHAHEKKLAGPFIISATALFYAGAAFAYFLVFPAAFKFFLSYQTADLKPMIAMKEYVSLVVILMIAFGTIFETPMIIFFLGLFGVVNSALLRKGRRYFVVIAFIIAAALTPTPDIINQCLMAIPMLFFYEIGILLLVMLERRRAKMEAKEKAESDEGEAAQD